MRMIEQGPKLNAFILPRTTSEHSDVNQNVPVYKEATRTPPPSPELNQKYWDGPSPLPDTRDFVEKGGELDLITDNIVIPPPPDYSEKNIEVALDDVVQVRKAHKLENNFNIVDFFNENRKNVRVSNLDFAITSEVNQSSDLHVIDSLDSCPPLPKSRPPSLLEIDPLPSTLSWPEQEDPIVLNQFRSVVLLQPEASAANKRVRFSQVLGVGMHDATKQPPQSPKGANLNSSVSDRKKFFETAMEDSQKSTKSDKVFSYLSHDELEKLKSEEERKIASFVQSESNSLHPLDHSDNESLDSQPTRPSSTLGIVRTAKAEKRLKDRLREEGLLTDEEDTLLSPAAERALRAEKRAAWRAARLKSLEQDAIQAQMVIKSMTDMVGAGEVPPSTIPEATKEEFKPSSADFPKLAVRSKPGNTTVRESEKVLGETITQRTEEYFDEITGEKGVRTVEYVEKLIEREVETLQEKIISLELTNSQEVSPDGTTQNIIPKEDQSASEPPTPTTGDERTLEEELSSAANKKKKRKRSKKGKH